MNDLWIDDIDTLNTWLPTLKAAEILALDTESDSMFVYEEKLCLIQMACISSGEVTHHFVLDPLRLGLDSLGFLKEHFLADKRVILHGGAYDIGIFKRDLGIGPQNLFDTQEAARLLGIRKTGYSSLVEEWFQRELDKRYQRFNWGKRPIPMEAQSYAFDDVRYLFQLYRILDSMADDKGISDEVAMSNAMVADTLPHHLPMEHERFWKLAPNRSATKLELKRLYALFLWREGLAKKKDLPPGRLIPNASLLAIAKGNPSLKSELREFRLGRHLPNDARSQVLQVLRTTLPELPQKPERERQAKEVQERLSALKDWRQKEAQKRKLEPQVIMTTYSLKALAEGEPWDAVPYLGEHRTSLYKRKVSSILGKMPLPKS